MRTACDGLSPIATPASTGYDRLMRYGFSLPTLAFLIAHACGADGPTRVVITYGDALAVERWHM